MEDVKLEREDTWDFERAARRPGRKGGRAVVSVAFARSDFDRVARRAEKVQMKTSEFIRRAALEKVDVVSATLPPSIFLSSGSGAIIVSEELPSITMASWGTEITPSEITTG